VTNESSLNVTISNSNITKGIKVRLGDSGTFLEGNYNVPTVDIAKSVKLREYTFDIGLVIDGKDYGQLPCSINISN
jgi:hypothetical protein